MNRIIFKQLYWYWYFLLLIFISTTINVNCETVDQTKKINQTGEICKVDRMSTSKVTERTSIMFNYTISYNCYINSSSVLGVFRNDNIEKGCTTKRLSGNAEKSIISLICNNIMNNAGRNWTFTFGSKSGFNQTIKNETFLVTFEPLPLKDLPNFEIIPNEELTSVSIFIPRCNEVSETKYLTVYCQNNENQTILLSDNCTITCSVKSNSSYNVLLFRSSVPKYNEITNTYETFSTDQRTENIHIGNACNGDQSASIKVMKRTWNMFVCNISYNCLLSNPTKLVVFKNNTIETRCKLNLTYPPVIEKTNVIITCDNIEDNAGRNWEFQFGSINNHKSYVINETFLITLEPFPLEKLPQFNLTINENITLASIVVPNCHQVAEMKYLYYRCGFDVNNQSPLFENCTFTCPIEPGRNQDTRVSRSPITKYDGTKNLNSTYLEEISPFNFYTGLDKAKNFHVEFNKTNDRQALIYFTRPRDYFDYVYIECFASKTKCMNSTNSSIGSIYKTCISCTFIAITPVKAGIEYECWANTSSSGNFSIKYKAIDFNTNLKPVLYQTTWLPNTAHITLNVIPQSDFDNIESICKADDKQKFICRDIMISSTQCSTKLSLILNITRGCDYQCVILTKKQGFADTHSETFSVSIPPSKPKIILSTFGARYISVNWTIDEPTYIDSFFLIVNNTSIRISDRTARSFNYTDKIHPNRPYNLYVELVSNTKVRSDEIFVLTAEDVPEKPRQADVDAKIIVSSDDRNLTLTQYSVSIDPSLFSNDNGNLIDYVVYVRQDMQKIKEEPDSDGTYENAINNPSKDYLATEIPLLTWKRDEFQIRQLTHNISLILGNETHCGDQRRCNGPLKPGTRYKVLVGSCTSAGCTYVLSKEFKTKSMVSPRKYNASLMWLITIPVVIILFIVGALFVWKRKVIQNYCANRHASTPSGVNAEFIQLDTVAR